MTNRPLTLPKWPFIFADVALLLGCAWVINQALPLKAYWAVAVAVAAWAFGAWICVLPWIKEFQSQAKFAENDSLTSALEQIQRLEEIGERIQSASGTWQTAQDAAQRVTATAKEIQERIKTDAKDFMEFAERINNDEKQHLRLEAEKLRRSEAEWLQVAARMLDHTFALTTAAVRSGQPNLATQMSNFQNACRDAARRVGLVPFHPTVGDPFEDRSQQLEDPNAKPEQGAVVSDILATGYTFQGQLLRKALVRVGGADSAQQIEPAPEQNLAEPPPTPETEQRSIEEAQAALAEVAEEIHEHRRDEIQDFQSEERSIPEVAEASETDLRAPESDSVTEDFVVDTYRPSNTLTPEEQSSVGNEVQNEQPVEEVAAVETTTDQSALESTIEVASHEPEPVEAVTEEKPRRRERKPDPQASLPF
jgi:molecular chaperone GrpE (heat shock protein)